MVLSIRHAVFGVAALAVVSVAVYSLQQESGALLTNYSATNHMLRSQSSEQSGSICGLAENSLRFSELERSTSNSSPSTALCDQYLAGSSELLGHTLWRKRGTLPLARWASEMIVAPRVQSPPLDATFRTTAPAKRHDKFEECIDEQVVAMRARQLQYQSPEISEVQSAVKRILAARGLSVTLVVFWGRHRYVSLLWEYLRRNLVTHMGVVNKLVFVTDFRDANPERSKSLLASVAKEAGVPVTIYKACSASFGCAFNQFSVDAATVYVKVDDDVIFIKDGSIEHMVYQMLENDDYVVYSGAVVNNPHSWAVHQLLGAHPKTTYHWQDTLSVPPDQPLRVRAAKVYYGANLGDYMGSKAHEAFVINAAIGRLDVYAFGLWNLNQCRCGLPQPQVGMCNAHGYYRWNINAIAWTFNKSTPIATSFNEPFISMEWPNAVAPHRSAIVGESLFVHCQVAEHSSLRCA